jgi:chaperonin GroEL
MDKEKKKQIVVFDTEAREALKRGVDLVANATKVTLGPKGRNVLISKTFGTHITKDGVTVARSISSNDPVENVGVDLMKDIANKVLEQAGDGTTTATILAQAIIQEGLKHLSAGINPMYLKKGIDSAVYEVAEYIKLAAIPVKEEDIIHVATISANNDPSIGSLIAEAVNKVGTGGLISVEESKVNKTYVEVVEGFRVDAGYISPYFMTDPSKMVAEYEDCMVLVTSRKITNMQQIVPLLEDVMRAGKPLLIICEDLEGEALTHLIVNKMQNILKLVAIKAPYFGDAKKAFLEDVAAITGTVVISEELQLALEKTRGNDLGKIDKLKVGKELTTIIGGKGSKDTIEERIALLKAQIETTDFEYDKQKLNDRIHRLSETAAIVFVGASTEVELKEKKDRVDDALCATLAAIEEGIVAGGSSVYLKAIKAIKPHKDPNINLGIEIVKKALEAPLKQILFNNGIEDSSIISKVKSSKLGYNAKTDKFEDLMKVGIIDPAKVNRVALENAAAITSLLLTTECVIIEEN